MSTFYSTLFAIIIKSSRAAEGDGEEAVGVPQEFTKMSKNFEHGVKEVVDTLYNGVITTATKFVEDTVKKTNAKAQEELEKLNPGGLSSESPHVDGDPGAAEGDIGAEPTKEGDVNPGETPTDKPAEEEQESPVQVENPMQNPDTTQLPTTTENPETMNPEVG